MARSSPSAREWERRQRQQQREAERQHRLEIAAQKAAEKAQREQYIAARKAEAEQRTAVLEQRVSQLQTILTTGLRHVARIDFAALKRSPSLSPFNPGALEVGQPQPTWERFAPPPPGALNRLFGGQQRYDQ